jgi:hypothetical protein
MKPRRLLQVFAVLALPLAFGAGAQPLLAPPDTTWQTIVESGGLPRLAPDVLSVGDPALRVSGAPGTFSIVERDCNAYPQEQVRRRIVDIAVQEWAWFGFQVDDLRGTTPPRPGDNNNGPRRRFLPLDPEQVAQVAGTVSGYWAAIPNSDWILARQNEAWKQPSGLSSRWRDPWSAAFISWVMCESGIGEQAQFQRAIAHHSYIDQAIRARDGSAPEAIFVAYDPGEAEIVPGDLICSGLRPVYRTLAQRRAQLGEGARTHCDIVVTVDEANARILTIGGNVRASVRMKIFPAAVQERAYLAPLPTNRYIFAHLKLKTPTIAPDAWRHSPSLAGVSCEQGSGDGTPASPLSRVSSLLC